MLSKAGKPDILVFLSDQHTASIMGCSGDPCISTPNLDRLAAEGTRFSNAYTACPLCVPARMAFLSGQLCSKTGILTNNGVLPSDQATIPYVLGAAGYETVLVGRMHFLGPDQRHGFEKRLVGDFTPCWHGRYGASRTDLGPYVGTPAGDFDKLYGGGTSPVIEYDRAVTKAAIEFLSQPHERPLFIVVGTYGPHHTFVAPEKLYRKYLDILPEPKSASCNGLTLPSGIVPRTVGREVTPKLRAAYYGLVEHIDSLVGKISVQWQRHLDHSGREGIFCYLSDHGEQAGEKGLWGKMTFYEESVAIPMIMSGSGIRSGQIAKSPVSILDMAPTICRYGRAQLLPHQDGFDLTSILANGEEDEERAVISEIFRDMCPGRMVRKGRWKYVMYGNNLAEDLLFDLESDPGEYKNCLLKNPNIANELRLILLRNWNPAMMVESHKIHQKHWDILNEWGKQTLTSEPDRWNIPERACKLPKY